MPTHPAWHAVNWRNLIPAALLVLASGPAAVAGDLAFSDPARTPPPPASAVGQANRTPDFDVLPGFHHPPAGFGVVPFYWWLGDPLTKERLDWELQQVANVPISGLQINYAHSDKGGPKWGLTFPSDPPLFSDQWWKLTAWFLQAAQKQGSAISLSDYTLGPGQGWVVDQLMREHPDLVGMKLVRGADGVVRPEEVPGSINPLHPQSGTWYADAFFGQFERHFPGQAGKGLNFFFSDELDFNIKGWLWSKEFAREFQRRKGYDVTPELAALFTDIGPRTPKIRLDYSDVMVALAEEGFFKPVFDWHQQRGMTLGCDHGGRGRDVTEFGDYFRTQRWMQGPGADQPNLGKNVIKAKVAASIAHLYERPRVWLEGFYGSGWGTTPAGVADATFTDFVLGYNLLSFHGMYYATHGGWWEWAPPDNTFRMPYWKHMTGLVQCVERLGFLLTQGHHQCDVAILYPVAAMEAGLDGPQAVQTAFTTGEKLCAQGIDFDFIDFESVSRALIQERELRVSGERYRVLVLPAMKAIRHETLLKALAFKRQGGVVVALGALPECSDRVGRNDPEVAAIVAELFPDGPVTDVVPLLPARDYDGPGLVQHRRIGPRDLYAIYGATQDAPCHVRAVGRAELWDPWTGTVRPLPILAQDAGGTTLKLPLSGTEIQLVVFSPGTPVREAPVARTARTLPIDGEWEFELVPTLDNRFGDFRWPPSPDKIGAEIRQLWYCEGDQPTGPWERITTSFGPQFLTSATADGRDAVRASSSWRWGIEDDPGHQGYHGLKEEMHDEFLAIGTRVIRGATAPEVFRYQQPIERPFFSTVVIAPRAMTAEIVTGALKPDTVSVNGQPVTGTRVALHAGPNPVIAHYAQPGRACLVFRDPSVPAPANTPNLLSSRWLADSGRLTFDVRASDLAPIGWYRFTAPPGLKALVIEARGKVTVTVDGQPVPGETRFTLPSAARKPAVVMLRIEQQRGCYAGAALPEPIRLECEPGIATVGDWGQTEGLACYSGSAWYRKTITVPALRAGTEAWLDLGAVACSAEVRVNGQVVGIRVSPPWRINVTTALQTGANHVEVLVCNTLANQYVTIPTRYRGPTTSGLLGPVRLEFIESP